MILNKLVLCCRNIYEALNLHCCPDKKKLNNDHLCPHRSEYSSLTHRTWIAVRILRVLRWASAKKDLARQCLSFQSLWFYSVFPEQNSSISNTAVCTKSCSICSLCWPKKKKKEWSSFSLAPWDADPGLRVHSSACISFVSCITHTSPGTTSCLFSLFVLVVGVVFQFVFQSRMLIWWFVISFFSWCLVCWLHHGWNGPG